MAKLIFEKHRVVIETPFQQAFVDALKAAVPSGYRTWQDTQRRWIVYYPHVTEARRLTKLYFANVQEVDVENYDFAEQARKAKKERNENIYEENERLRKQAEEFARKYGSQYNRQRESEYQSANNQHTGSSVGWYSVLFVTPSAPVEVIEAAYKALARKYHPDNGGDTQRMQEINAAYSALRKART